MTYHISISRGPIYAISNERMCKRQPQVFAVCGCKAGYILSLCEESNAPCASSPMGNIEYLEGSCKEHQVKKEKKAFRHTFWFALVIHENRNIIVRGIEFCFSPKVNYAFFSWIFSRLSYISAISWLCYICRPAFAEDRIERLAHVNYYLSSDFILPTVDIFILYLFTFNIAYFKSNMILSIV